MGNSHRIDAHSIYTTSIIEGLRYDENSKSIILYDMALVEDDADGCGWPYDQDILGESVVVKKVLHLERPNAHEAKLVLFHCGDGAPVRANVSVNGHVFEAKLSKGWNAIPFEPGWLLQGANQVVVASVDPFEPVCVPLADLESILLNAPERNVVPQSSYKSTDGGKSWTQSLGEGRDARGEYMLRLSLRQFSACGTCLLPVLDTADLACIHTVKKQADVRTLTVSPDCDRPEVTQLSVQMRTGSTPIPPADAWSEWAPLSDPTAYPLGRYFQLKVDFSTGDPLATPALRGMDIHTDVAMRAVSSPGRLEAEVRENHPIVRSAIPFRYESLDHPLLRRLRQKYHLDKVVRDAESQFDAVVRLNHWVSRQWQWHPPDPYPRWDALDLLDKQPDGQSLGGFCGQYAIVLVQCCLAMGIQARFVFGSFPPIIYGHEVTEFWSDDHGKWVLMDPNMDRHYLDRQTKTPLNALDLHRAILDYWFDGGGIADAEHNRRRFEARSLERFREGGPVAVHGGNDAGPDWFDPECAHLMWGHPNLMPRNNFFSERLPIPKAHGMGLPWSWNGYWHWFDSCTSRPEHFVRYTDREQDFYWSVNQVHIVLEETDRPGVLRVSIDTFTPDLDAVLASIDAEDWEPVSGLFLWELQSGTNSIRAKTRNRAGMEGRASLIRVIWQP